MQPPFVTKLSAALTLMCLGCPARETEGQADASTGSDSTDTGSITFVDNRDVDILFVIDDSRSMADAQARLARSLERLVGVLEGPKVRANYRIAFTTTDHGNPWCPETRPERGAFVASSCRDRIEEFRWEPRENALGMSPGFAAIDRTDVCNDGCPAELAITTLPTTTDVDATPRPRPWIERTEGLTNLPEGMTPAQALGCMAPQGIAGCGFVQPLESMYAALERTATEGDPAHGFMRERAPLVIVIVTDATDCSYNDEWVDIFSATGNRVFWSLPDAAAPTPAVCWNAGIECTGGPGRYDECHAANLDIEGLPVFDDRVHADADSVLHPLHRYAELLEEIRERKQQWYAAQDVLVALVAGVPTDFPASGLLYEDAPEGTPGDARYQDTFGIGPGCIANGTEAVPPVRERELAETFHGPGPGEIFSICADDLSPAMETLGLAIAHHLRPVCVPACVADTDPTTPNVLDERCEIVERRAFTNGSIEDSRPIPKCLDERGTIPVDATHCYIAIDVYNDPDAASEECREDGYNLELELFKRPVELPPDVIAAYVELRCEWSPDRRVDCPGLGS